jgi:hypothetical protein
MHAPHRYLSDEWNASHIGRLLEKGQLTRAEFETAKIWREIYTDYLMSIGAPGYEPVVPMSDLRCEQVRERVYRGIAELKKVGRRSLHAINALVVYCDPEELGDFEFTVSAAKKGLAHLVVVGL